MCASMIVSAGGDHDIQSLVRLIKSLRVKVYCWVTGYL